MKEVGIRWNHLQVYPNQQVSNLWPSELPINRPGQKERKNEISVESLSEELRFEELMGR